MVKNEDTKSDYDLTDIVRDKSRRKMQMRNKKHKGLLYGLGMFGLVGWSVAIPALALLATGVWIDNLFPGGYSWTLMLLTLGIIIGCMNAWYWVNREAKED